MDQVPLRMKGLAPTIKIRQVDISAETYVSTGFINSIMSLKQFLSLIGKNATIWFFISPIKPNLHKTLAPPERSFFLVSRNLHHLNSEAHHFNHSLHKVAGHTRCYVSCSGHGGHDYYSGSPFPSGIQGAIWGQMPSLVLIDHMTSFLSKTRTPNLNRECLKFFVKWIFSHTPLT